MKAEKYLSEDYLAQKLNSEDPLTAELIGKGIKSFGELLEYMRVLPYGRNSNRSDLGLVIKEKKGTCSSKHACTKLLADLNNIKDVQLMLCLYKMKETNTPGIGSHLSKNNLTYLPEAHCYLKVKDQKIDLTNIDSDLNKLENDILKEVKIVPSQTDKFKVTYHKDYLKTWIKEKSINIEFDALWKIREACIQELSNG